MPALPAPSHLSKARQHLAALVHTWCLLSGDPLLPQEGGEGVWDLSHRSGVPVCGARVPPGTGSSPPLCSFSGAAPCPVLTTWPPLQMVTSSASLIPRAPGGTALAVSTGTALAHPPGLGLLLPPITSSPTATASTHHQAALPHTLLAEWSRNGPGNDTLGQDEALLPGGEQSLDQIFTISHSLQGMAIPRIWFLSCFIPKTPSLYGKRVLEAVMPCCSVGLVTSYKPRTVIR